MCAGGPCFDLLLLLWLLESHDCPIMLSVTCPTALPSGTPKEAGGCGCTGLVTKQRAGDGILPP